MSVAMSQLGQLINQSENLDNALVKIKDTLLLDINEADVEAFQHVLSKLTILYPIFKTCTYAYKGMELCERAIDRLYKLRSALAMQARKQHKDITELIEQFSELNTRYLWAKNTQWANA